MEAAVRLLAQVIALESGRSLVGDSITKTFPWARFLPDRDRITFASELAEVIEGASQVNQPGAIDQLVEQWRGTAEVWADPSALERLHREPEDGGLVPRPS